MPPAKAKTITLADLSDADRKALVEQAREELMHNPRDVPGYAGLSDRERAFRELMDARDHSRGCPVAEGTELGRVEGFEARKPPNPALGQPERFLGVARCVECGGTTILEERLEDAIEGLADREPVAAGVAGGEEDAEL